MNTLQKINAHWYPQRLYYAPKWIILCVNNACNLHCKMCDVGTRSTNSNFYQHMMGARPINMPFDLLKKVIDQTAAYYPSAKLGFAFTEPSVYPHLLEGLNYAHQKGLYTSLTTNGLVLAKQAADLCRAGLNELNVSVDGPADVHNLIRGHAHAFQKAFEGMQKILAMAGRPKLSVFCAITPWNIGRLTELAQALSPLAIEQLGYMHTVFVTEETAHLHNAQYGHKYPAAASSVEELNFNSYNLAELYNEQQQLMAEQYPFKVSFTPMLNSAEALHNYYHSSQPIGRFCNDAFNNLMVKSDGTVIPAHSRCYTITMGNLHNHTLPEIWNSAQATAFRKDLVKAGGLLPACTRCCSAH